jgi:hypothetical protein
MSHFFSLPASLLVFLFVELTEQQQAMDNTFGGTYD